MNDIAKKSGNFFFEGTISIDTVIEIPFSGWNTAADGTGTPYANEASVTLTEDLTLYAQWTKNVPMLLNSDDNSTAISNAYNDGKTGVTRQITKKGKRVGA